MNKPTRRTKIKQVLDIQIDLGEVPPEARPRKLRVVRKRDRHEMFINASDYEASTDMQRDYMPVLNYDPDEIKLIEDAAPVHIEDSLYSADEMATMSVEKMRELPEYSRLTTEQLRSINTKQSLVEALIAARRDAVPPQAAQAAKSAKSNASEDAREAL